MALRRDSHHILLVDGKVHVHQAASARCWPELSADRRQFTNRGTGEPSFARRLAPAHGIAVVDSRKLGYWPVPGQRSPAPCRADDLGIIQALHLRESTTLSAPGDEIAWASTNCASLRLGGLPAAVLAFVTERPRARWVNRSLGLPARPAGLLMLSCRKPCTGDKIDRCTAAVFVAGSFEKRVIFPSGWQR